VIKDGCRPLLAIVCGCSLFGSMAGAQTSRRERETTITGPRGRTIDRRIEVDRGPGFYDRSLQIQRPGMTLQRGFQVQGGVPVPRPGVLVERNIFVGPRPASAWSFGFMAAPMITFPFWQPALPPVVVAPPGGMVAQPGAVMPAPQPGATTGATALDPVALAAQRMQSYHSGSRREGAETLGRLGDPRAIPPLVNALKYDSSKDVKIASATALGAIGGREAEVVLERCIVYEKKQEVRDAAAIALRDLRARSAAESRVASSAAPAPSVVPRLPDPALSPGMRRAPSNRRTPAPEPALEGPAAEDNAGPAADRVPPPPPTPVTPQ
jgi:hypothetical protein